MARIYIEKGMKAELDSNVAFALEELFDLIDEVCMTEDKAEAI